MQKLRPSMVIAEGSQLLHLILSFIGNLCAFLSGRRQMERLYRHAAATQKHQRKNSQRNRNLN